MTATLTPVEVSAITTGNQLFRCVPYNCAMLARACVTRQSQADSAFPPAHLMLCKGCELGREVKHRATDVVTDPHAAARASRKHIAGVPARAARVSLPIIGLELEAAAPAAPWKPWANRVLEVFDADPSPYVVACARCRGEFSTSKALGAHHVHCTATQMKDEGPMPKSIELKIGKEIAGIKIVAQLPSQGEGTLARVQFPCGHEDTMLAFLLNSYAKNGTTRRCKLCKAAKPPKTAPSPETLVESPAPRAKEPKPAPRKGAQARPALSPVKRSPSFQTDPRSYEFPLRRDFAATLTLPTDLTMHDVERLTRWLETLVLDDVAAAE